MSVPLGLMPGGPGPGAMETPAPGGGGPGGPGGPEGILKILAGLQQSPPPDGEDQMLNQASMMLNAAYARIAPRSAKAARALMQANVQIQTARESLKAEGSRPLAAPPDLGMGMAGGMTGGGTPPGPMF